VSSGWPKTARWLCLATVVMAGAAAPLALQPAGDPPDQPPAPPGETTPEASPAEAAPPSGGPLVIEAEYEGVIHPIAVEYLVQAFDRADAANAAMTLVVLRTPGGLVDSTRAIITRMLATRAPVVVYVAPSGERAASAGFLLTLAADVAAMAPGTHIGAAHPVSGDGQQVDETMAKKAASDVAAYARTLAEQRKRNVELSSEAVTESRSFTAEEALNAQPPLIDVVARDRDDLLRQLDGRAVTRVDGRATELRLTGARVEPVELTARQRLLSTVAHPQIAYLLFSLGLLGLTVELWNPGLVVPGVVGGVCLLLALFAFSVLPVNAAGLALIVLGLGLLALEVKTPTFGVLGIGGVISLAFGSMMLIDVGPSEIQIGGGIVWAVSLAFGGLFVFLGRLALVSQQRAPAMGPSAMLGLEAQALGPIAPGAPGQVAVRGEIWRARARQPIPAGAAVRVAAVDELTVTVEPLADADPERTQS
jgi:membrane-bound serine protease (ClpP class)